MSKKLALGLVAIVGGSLAAAAWYYTRPPTLPTLVVQKPAATTLQPSRRAPSADERIYDNGAFGFSLYYPKGLIVAEHGKGTDLTVLFKNKDAPEEFQVFITPYSEPTITQERFAADLPSLAMSNPVDITVDGAAATAFISSNQATGATQEVWFLHNGYLYEVVAPKDLGTWLLHILETWEFK